MLSADLVLSIYRGHIGVRAVRGPNLNSVGLLNALPDQGISHYWALMLISWGGGFQGCYLFATYLTYLFHFWQ